MILLILACSGGNAFLPPLSSGRLSVCLDGVGTADLEEGETSLVGTVTAAGKGDCGIAMTVEDGEGNSHTVSLGVTTGQDVATEDSLGDSLGKAVEILFVNIQPWGAASGFKVWDEEGIWLAADEGQWGGALNGKMPEGFSVDAGKEKIASDDIGCGNRVGTTMIFRGRRSWNWSRERGECCRWRELVRMHLQWQRIIMSRMDARCPIRRIPSVGFFRGRSHLWRRARRFVR